MTETKVIPNPLQPNGIGASDVVDPSQISPSVPQPNSVGGVYPDDQISVPYHTHDGINSPLIGPMSSENNGGGGSGGAGTPASPSTSIQFNNGGVFGGSASLLWLDDETNSGIVRIGESVINGGDPTLAYADLFLSDGIFLINTEAAAIPMRIESGDYIRITGDGNEISMGFSGDIHLAGSASSLLINGNNIIFDPGSPSAGFQILNTTKAALFDVSLITGTDKTMTFQNASGTVAFLSDISGGFGGAFTDLSDVPPDYTGSAGLLVAVNGTEDGLEFISMPPAAAAGSDTNVQFNDTNALAGSNDFTWDGSKLTINGDYYFGAGVAEGISRIIRVPDQTIVNDDGNPLSIRGGAGNGNGGGGGIQIEAGGSGDTAGDGGSLNLSAGNGFVNGGDVYIVPGHGDTLLGHLKIRNDNSVHAIIDITALSADETFTFLDESGTVVISPGHSRATAQTAANTNVLTFTVGAADGTFQLLANVLVTVSTLHSFGVTVDYTDESNVARTLTIPFAQLAGTLLTAITNGTGAGPYEGVGLTIRAKAATNIVFKTAGTFTTVTYNVDASVIQIA